MSKKLANQFDPPLETVELVKLRGVGKENDNIEARRVRNVNIKLGDGNYMIDVYVASIEDPLLLGFDFMVENKCKIDLEHNVMIISGDSVEASLSKYPNGEPLRLARVMNVHKEVIPPYTVTRIDAHFDKFEDRSEFDDLVVEALQLEDSDKSNSRSTVQGRRDCPQSSSARNLLKNSIIPGAEHQSYTNPQIRSLSNQKSLQA